MDRLGRFIECARLLTGRYADTIDPALRGELALHFDRHDFTEGDIVTTLERLPARMRRLLRCFLRDAGDE